jgi:hypothetical protein
MTKLSIFLLYLFGVAAFVGGCWLIYRPLGCIVAGVLMVVLSMLIEKEQKHV